jgi:hypothetical protein
MCSYCKGRYLYYRLNVYATKEGVKESVFERKVRTHAAGTLDHAFAFIDKCRHHFLHFLLMGDTRPSTHHHL